MALTQSNKAPGELLRSSDWNELLAETRRLDSDKLNKNGDAVRGNLTVSGALAIGTTQFGSALNVVSATGVQARLQQTNNNDFARLSINANGNEWHLAVGAPGVAAMAGNLNLWSAASNRNVLSLVPAGNVGVGVPIPNAPLHIGGGNWNVGESNGDLKIGNDTYALKIGVALGGGGAGDVRIRAMGGTNRLFLGGGTFDTLNITGNAINVPSGTLGFGSQVRQMINLWGQGYGIGVQSGTAYFRSDRNFAWFTGGSHHDGELNAGGGRLAMHLTNSNLTVSGAISAGNSDLYFTKTDHNHSGVGNTNGFAAIENAADHSALMILGRAVPGRGRVVKLWDILEVHGSASKPGGGSWGGLSDLQLKQNVEPLTGALERLLRLRGVSYEWQQPERQGNLHGRQIGMVAQDVEQVFPEWVSQDADGYKMLAFRGFEALTVEALRDLQSQIHALATILSDGQPA